jgi:hypothetical protein
MAPTEEAFFFREAAAKCRKGALSSANPKQWIDLAEQWEWLADTAGWSSLFEARASAPTPSPPHFPFPLQMPSPPLLPQRIDHPRRHSPRQHLVAYQGLCRDDD